MTSPAPPPPATVFFFCVFSFRSSSPKGRNRQPLDRHLNGLFIFRYRRQRVLPDRDVFRVSIRWMERQGRPLGALASEEPTPRWPNSSLIVAANRISSSSSDVGHFASCFVGLLFFSSHRVCRGDEGEGGAELRGDVTPVGGGKVGRYWRSVSSIDSPKQ